MNAYDIVTIGGGLGGAALARTMAANGARVLVLERTREFKDRVRGEVLVPWGCQQASELGLYELLRESCGHELVWWHGEFDGIPALARDMRTATEQGFTTLTYYHPHMQELLWSAARDAGAEMLRGATVTGVLPGARPRVQYKVDGVSHEIEARLIVAADGRGSAARQWGRFTEKRDRQRRYFAGVLMEDLPAPEDSMCSRFVSTEGLMSWIFPQGGGRVRAYVGFAAASQFERLSGDRDLGRFVETSIRIGVPPAYFANARAAGPLATFDATDNWVEHPYKDGIALIGDAAATGDPTWGQGMSQTLRDVLLLSQSLLAEADWDAAGHRYAERHDGSHANTHRADNWHTDLFLDTGPEADATRARALPKLLEDPSRLLDTPLGGPWIAADESARVRMFAEDVADRATDGGS